MNYFSNLNLLPPPSVSLFRDLLWYVLSSSFIHFDETDEYFVQTSGVAMGSCISIFAANCYVWETMRPSCDLLDLRCTLSLDHPDDEQHDEQHDDAHDHDFRGGVGTDDFNAIDTANNGVLFLARYVDDFLVVATTADDSCALFHQFNLDSPGEGLTFTTCQEDPTDGTVDFLDLKLRIETGVDGEYFVLSGALVDKSRLTNLNVYFRERSCHPTDFFYPVGGVWFVFRALS